MRYVKLTAYLEGEALVEPRVPLICLPFMRWVCKMLGASMTIGPVIDTRKKQEPQP